MEPETAQPMPQESQETPEVQETQETQPLDTPAPKRRGRPPGAKNRPKIVVEAPAPLREEPKSEPEPPAPPEETPKQQKPPRVVMKKPVVPVASQATPHQTFLSAMRAWQVMADHDRNARSTHYHNLVDAMFK